MGLAKLLYGVAVLLALAFVSTWPAQSFYQSKAKLIQVVQRASKDDVFADGDTPIGSPQVGVVLDEKAFLPDKTDVGAFKVDDAYMSQHSLRPLQMQTVNYLAFLTRVSTGPLALLSFLLAKLLAKGAAKKSSEQAA